MRKKIFISSPKHMKTRKYLDDALNETGEGESDFEGDAEGFELEFNMEQIM